MTDDPIGTLELELLAAAGRRVAGVRPARRRSPRLAGVAVVLPVLVTLAVAVGALILLGAHRSPAPASGSQSGTAQGVSIPGRRELVEIIGVLRRPQANGDLPSWLRSKLSTWPRTVLQGAPDLALVRLAARTPWGETLYFVPMRVPTRRQLARLVARFRGARTLIAGARRHGETLDLVSAHGGSGAGSAAAIEAGQALETEGVGRSFAYGSSKTRVILVVPDGVTRVEFLFPRRPYPGVRRAPIYKHGLLAAVPVHDNVAAVQIGRSTDGEGVRMLWYAADGRVIKRIGNLATLVG